ncbi:MAG: preprotein translocase subunit SecE [Chloroflexi bacterium]|nr:MAG: preprotein translocase subunit SecE [Chloroflexota bacterium]
MARAVPTEPRSNRVQRTTPSPTQRRGLIRNLEDIVGELRKVIWPSWAELRTMTFVVIVTVVVVSIMLGLIDYVLTQTLVKVEFPKIG